MTRTLISVVCEICRKEFKHGDKRRNARFCSIPCRSVWSIEANRLRAYVMDDEAKAKRRETYKVNGKRGEDHHGWKGGSEASRLRVMAKGSRAEQLREYRARVPHKVSKWSADRRARQAHAAPPWASKEDTENVYLTAGILNEITRKPHHVDHIIPLAGKSVCGLHVPSNLRAIPSRLNCRKSARVPANPEHLKERGHQYFVAAVLKAIRLGVLVLDPKAARELA